MLGNLGGGELILLLVIALLVFGANRLPEAGRTVGKGLRQFRRALSEAQDAVTRTPPADPVPPGPIEPKRLSD
ncbi:MAG TPA: twin-arginine translocase TatA/TatE family subunit [Gemmatimonadales bacterium]